MASRPVCALASLSLGALTILISACSSGGGSPSGTPEGPLFSPVPSGTVIDLAAAERLYHDGDFESAITIYSAAAQKGSEEQRQQGLWALARIQAERGDYRAAERTIEAFRDTGPDAEADRLALLLLGTAEFAQGDMKEARRALEDYVDTGGAASPYALLNLAAIEASEGDTDEAEDRTEEALATGLPSSVNVDALLTLAGFIRQGQGEGEDVIAALERAVEASVTDVDAAEALWELAAAAEEAGQAGKAEAALARIVKEFPGQGRAAEALSHPLLTTSAKVSTFERALVLFRHQLNDQAQTAFQAVIDSGAPEAPRAHYYMGILAERAALWDDAIAHYDAALAALTSGTDATLRAQVLWDRATVLERLGRTEEAVAGYASVPTADPTHEQAAEAAFRAGLLTYQQGAPGLAITYWQTMADVAPNAEESARANFWLGKAWDDLGEPETAAGHYSTASTADPLGYYGLRAAAVLGSEISFPDAQQVQIVIPNWSRAEAWLTDVAGPEDAEATDALFAGQDWLRAVELLEAGLAERADAEFSRLVAVNAGNPWLTYRLARGISVLGRPWISSPAAAGLLGEGVPPPEVLGLIYPLEHLETARREANENGISPLLLLSLVRQESLYDPSAISSADAMGLTQVIPLTADEIASHLGVNDFTYNDLLRPKVALRFGAYYLGSQVEGFGGQVAPALAAYNGGPGNAGYWWELGGGDPDLFLESIEFPETRAYVELVLENYARYLYAYGLTETPSLPLSG